MNILRSITLVLEKIVIFGDRSISTPIPSVSSARDSAAKRKDGAAGWPRCWLVIERRDLASSSGNVGVSQRDHPRLGAGGKDR